MTKMALKTASFWFHMLFCSLFLQLFVVQLVYNRFSGAPASQTQKTKHVKAGKARKTLGKKTSALRNFTAPPPVSFLSLLG